VVSRARRARQRVVSLVLEVLEKIRFAKYSLVGIIPFAANALTTIILSYYGFSAEDAARTGFLVGGQFSFWAHDRITYRDRYPTIHGWTGRWAWFMLANATGFVVTYLATLGLGNLSAPPWLIFIGALTGVPIAYFASKHISHPDPEL
jgi:putative flippase GtrA